jgi:GNAT superfamily N-acetyltransferase
MQRGNYRLRFAPEDIDARAAHAFLVDAYWSEGIPLALVERSIANSLCIALHAEGVGQVGFARVVTDRTTFGYLCDVYVLDVHRGHGLAKWMIETLLAHADLQGLRRFMLFTRDAHDVYRGHGFSPLAKPQRGMEIVRPGLYLKP